MYQGAQMLDLNHSCFSTKIMLLRDYFNPETTLGKMLNIALDAFIVGTGLDEEVFNMDFKQHGGLATKGWYRHLWELFIFLNVRIQEKFARRLRPIRKGDVPFMAELIVRNKGVKCLGSKDLVIVGMYWKFKKIYFLSEIPILRRIHSGPGGAATQQREIGLALPKRETTTQAPTTVGESD